jgi:hypothetical protein
LFKVPRSRSRTKAMAAATVVPICKTTPITRARKNSALAWPGCKASADEHRLAFLSGQYHASAISIDCVNATPSPV